VISGTEDIVNRHDANGISFLASGRFWDVCDFDVTLSITFFAAAVIAAAAGVAAMKLLIHAAAFALGALPPLHCLLLFVNHDLTRAKGGGPAVC